MLIANNAAAAIANRFGVHARCRCCGGFGGVYPADSSERSQ